MTQFIDLKDYDATVHHEIIDALTRSDETIPDICEDRAISEMKSYMSGRYNVEEIFAARGENRHPLVLMVCLDIAVYHIYCVGNPMKLSQMRKDRYDRAIEWLKAVQKGQIDVNGAPTITEEERDESAVWSSNTKRLNHF